MTYLEKWFDYTNHQMAMQASIEQAITKVEGSKLNLNEFLLLYFLNQAHDNRLFQNKLEDKLHLSASAISRMIAKLEAKGCGVIAKVTCSKDKRATYITLTPVGKDLLAKVLKEVEGNLAQYKDILG